MIKINAAQRLAATSTGGWSAMSVADSAEDGDWELNTNALGNGELVNAKIGGQPLSDSFGRQQLKKFGGMIQKGKTEHELGTKDGLTLYELKDGVDRVFAIWNGERIAAYGKLEDSPYSNRWRMYNLYVDPQFRGLKLATVLHLGALNRYKHLESDTTMSMGALQAFRSLERYSYKLKMLDTESGKTVPFKWGTDGIPVVNGASIEDAENYALYV